MHFRRGHHPVSVSTFYHIHLLCNVQFAVVFDKLLSPDWFTFLNLYCRQYKTAEKTTCPPHLWRSWFLTLYFSIPLNAIFSNMHFQFFITSKNRYIFGERERRLFHVEFFLISILNLIEISWSAVKRCCIV